MKNINFKDIWVSGIGWSNIIQDAFTPQQFEEVREIGQDEGRPVYIAESCKGYRQLFRGRLKEVVWGGTHLGKSDWEMKPALEQKIGYVFTSTQEYTEFLVENKDRFIVYKRPFEKEFATYYTVTFDGDVIYNSSITL